MRRQIGCHVANRAGRSHRQVDALTNPASSRGPANIVEAADDSAASNFWANESESFSVQPLRDTCVG